MIGPALSSLVCACLAALFEVHSFPLPEPGAHVLLANADADATADVLILDRLRLTVHSSAADYAPIMIPLADGASAFDVVDLDGDGRSEVIAVCHDRILRYAIPAEGTSPPAQELFALQTELGPAPSPYPQVLAVKYEGRSLLALPCTGAVELRSADGTLVTKYDTVDRASLSVLDLERMPTLSWRGRGREGDLRFRVSIRRWCEPESPIAGIPFAPFPNDLRKRPSTVAVYKDLSEVPCAGFPLKTDGTTLLRAVCQSARRGQNTTVRIREAKSEEDDFLAKDITLGPKRMYSGQEISYDDDYPDFDGDGYVDLALWKVPSPGVSVDALTRAITGGAWPLDLVFHLFSPEKRRFEATSCSRIALTVPVRWFLEGEPVQNEVFRDFDGDKRTDFALSDTDHSFSAWLFTDNGFSRSPDFRHTFPESIQDVAFRADLDGSGRTSIGLRTDKHLYLLKATS